MTYEERYIKVVEDSERAPDIIRVTEYSFSTDATYVSSLESINDNGIIRALWHAIGRIQELEEARGLTESHRVTGAHLEAEGAKLLEMEDEHELA